MATRGKGDFECSSADDVDNRLALEALLPPSEFQFFSSIAASGILDGAPYVRLRTNQVLFGYSDGGYYRAIFEANEREFRSLNLVREAWGAAFDSLISYHYENAFPILKTQFLVPGGIVMDVGVRGSHYAVKALNRGASRVICVDPTDEARRLFELHRRFNELSNIHFYKVALAETTKSATFWYGSAGESWSGLLEKTLYPDGSLATDPRVHSGAMHLETTTLDAICEDLARLDLLVLETNGTELAILQGGAQVLQTLQPVVHVTFGQVTDLGQRPDDEICSFMRSLQYRRIMRTDGADVYAHG